MNTIFIIPTGIGCTIGGHAGDATPAFKLIASLSDIAICHPNVVNASDINEMPENSWYVEGSILDRFLEGKIGLKQPKSNKILLVTNKPILNETLNAINAARYTIGCNIESVELETELKMIGRIEQSGATGEVYGWEELINQIQNYTFDALAIASRITVPKEIILNYLKHGGVNPWGGIESITSKLIAGAIDKPTAHAPIENDDPEIYEYNEIVNPRMAAEIISRCYLHCVLKGLHKAPRSCLDESSLWVDDIDCLVTPDSCFGRPHIACLQNKVPVIVVKENKTCLNNKMPDNFIFVENYLEAVGIVACIKNGINPIFVRA